MTQQMFSFDVPVRSYCAVYDTNPLPVRTAHDNLKNAYRCALEDRDTALHAFKSAKRKLGYANKAKIEGDYFTKSRAEQKVEALRQINRARATLRRAVATLGQAYDAISPSDAASVLRSWEA